MDVSNALKNILSEEETEKEYLTLILKKSDCIKYTRIKGEWFINEKYGKLFKYFVDTYRKTGAILLQDLNTNYSDFKKYIDLWVELITDSYTFDNSNTELLVRKYEEAIVDNYKSKKLKELETKRDKKEITYEKFMELSIKLHEIKIFEKKNTILDIKDIKEGVEEEKVLSNSKMLDSLVGGFTLGELSVWSGSNGGAKSTYLNQLALESIEQGYNTLIYSGELTSDRLLKWILNQCCGKHNMKFNNDKCYFYIPNEVRERMINWLNGKLFIYDNSQGCNAKDIIESVKESIEKRNVKVIFIDNLMSIELQNYDENKYDAQSMFIQELVNIAHEYKVHIHFVCHPRKATSFLRKNDISGTGDLSNKADNVFILHRVNEDFKKNASEFYGKGIEALNKYSNVIEICKCRDNGSAVDNFVGLYFQNESKRLLDTPDEIRKYEWEIEK